MSNTTSNMISEAIFAQTRLEVRETLENLRSAIWKRIDARELVLDSDTGFKLYLRMYGERFDRAYEARQHLRSCTIEDHAIIKMIQRELAKL